MEILHLTTWREWVSMLTYQSHKKSEEKTPLTLSKYILAWDKEVILFYTLFSVNKIITNIKNVVCCEVVDKFLDLGSQLATKMAVVTKSTGELTKVWEEYDHIH